MKSSKRANCNFDENMTKPYFEQKKVLNGLLEIVSNLFNMEFKPANTPTWHEKVKVLIYIR